MSLYNVCVCVAFEVLVHHPHGSHIMFSSHLDKAFFSFLSGGLFCSSLRLNPQSNRDKVPTPRLAPHHISFAIISAERHSKRASSEFRVPVYL